MGDEFENENNYRDAECCEHCEHYEPSHNDGRVVFSQPSCEIGSMLAPHCASVCDKFSMES